MCTGVDELAKRWGLGRKWSVFFRGQSLDGAEEKIEGDPEAGGWGTVGNPGGRSLGAVAHAKDKRDWLEKACGERMELEKSKGVKLDPV
jgi:hypothetical protein